MPHSSGGGSHGGGSFHSSSSYHSSGSSSTTYVEPFKRSHNPFPHCHTYYYYRPDGIHYVYTNKKIEEETTKPFSKTAKIVISIIISVFLVLGIFLIKSGINYVPNKLKSNDICLVDDKANLINNDNEILNLLKEFKEKTGIAFTIETINNENWINYYYGLENYAYESYLKHFNEENGWLIVYSEPISPDSNFNDWYWEGMQGDNTDSIITNEFASNFGDFFQKELLRKGNLQEALKSTISNFNLEVMKPRNNEASIIGGIFIFIIGIIIAISVYCHESNIKKRGYHDSELYEFKDGQVLKTCPYCGKEFLNTGFKKCPFCEEELEN